MGQHRTIPGLTGAVTTARIAAGMDRPRVAESRMTGGRLTIHGKRLVAESMYAKGKSFLGAAILLRQKGGYEYVVLHLLCQGIEIVLKALLLLRAYETYKPKLKVYSHNLETLVDGVVAEFKLHPLRSGPATELHVLNSLYASHRLRYGSFYDVLVDPLTISSGRVLRRMMAVVRLAERHLACRPPSNDGLAWPGAASAAQPNRQA